MTQEERTDQIFRQKLHSAAVPPPAQVWAEVARTLRKRRRRVIAWWILTAALTAGLGSGWWYHTTAALTADAGQAAISACPTANNSVAATFSSPTPSSLPPSPPPQKEELSSGNSAFPAPVSSPKTAQSRLLYEKSKAATQQQPANANTNLITAPLSAAQPADTGTGYAALPPEDLPLAANSDLNVTVPVFADMDMIASAALPNYLFRHVAMPVLQPVRIIRKKKEQTDKCYNFDTHPNVWMGELYAGPVTAHKKLSRPSNPELSRYVQQRYHTEGQGWGFVAGARAGILLNRHYLLQSGVEYEQFSEVFRYSDPSSIIVYTKQVYNPQTGQSTLDTISIEFGSETTRIINRFGRIEVPLSAGYEWRHQRYGWRVTGGAALNVFFWKRGAILDPQSGEPAWFTPETGQNEVFRSRTGLSAHGAAQLFWHPATTTRLFVEPYYRKILHSVTLDSHPLAQRYHIWGIRLGGALIF